MEKLTEYIIVLFTLLILSGLIIAKYESNNNKHLENLSNTSTKIEIKSNITNITKDDNITTTYYNNSNITSNMSNLETKSVQSTKILSNLSWCQSNSKVTINLKNFTIEGLENYKGYELCKAYIITPNFQTIHYFSEDGKIQYESSVGKGNVSSSAVAVSK